MILVIDSPSASGKCRSVGSLAYNYFIDATTLKRRDCCVTGSKLFGIRF